MHRDKGQLEVYRTPLPPLVMVPELAEKRIPRAGLAPTVTVYVAPEKQIAHQSLIIMIINVIVIR
jgi:hypothetical protein